MSRSKHTRPDDILAAARLRDPYAARGKDDRASYRGIARSLKESGVVLDLPEIEGDEYESAPMPRVVVKRPRRDFLHPAQKNDIVAVLDFFGERCYYGLRLVKLVQGEPSVGDGVMRMGRLDVPGTIVLFDQPKSPWLINGAVAGSEAKRLQNAGASIQTPGDGHHSLVHWSDANLKNFMLFEVFMHEIGHHIIQQYKGKRNARVARTKEHELFAELFAQRCREEFLAAFGELDAQ